MCGICGIVSKVPLVPEHVARVARMNGAMVHRGPDGEGFHRDARIAMAMRRLSIIDLQGGWQPLYNEDRSLTLICNGEIYNFVELRESLEKRGHRFTTHSDCETILHLYEERGRACVHDLRGMFAFALWDNPRQRLLLARDRMGEKPLYLWEQEGMLVFASECKALLRSGLVPFELDPEGVNLFFHYQYVPEPGTAIRGVRKLPAGHLLTVDVETWRRDEKRYWFMEDAPPLEGDPAEVIRRELEEVSRIVIRSDVPVGIALSGGLDSSALAALVAKWHPENFQAITVGYEGRPACDERVDAVALANHLGIPIHEVVLSTGEMVEHWPQLVLQRDDPIADPSGFGYYMVMKAAREHGVPVMLQGQGGDELFWGYPWVKQAALDSAAKARVVERRQQTVPSKIAFMQEKGVGLRPVVPSTTVPVPIPQCEDNQLIFYQLTPDFAVARRELTSLYAREFVDRVRCSDPCALFSFPHPWHHPGVRMTRLISDTYLRGNGVAQGDRLGMASSVEQRLPFLDHRLVETVIGLRKCQSDVTLAPKAWLKTAVCGILPLRVFNRPKRGFEPPTEGWLRALSGRYSSTLDGGYLVKNGVLDSAAARQVATKPDEVARNPFLTHKALLLEMWCRHMSEFNSLAKRD